LTLTQLAYLHAESLRLLAQHRELQRQFESLRGPHLCRTNEWVAYRQRLREHWGLLANHRVALEWALYPPCGRTGASSPLMCRKDLFSVPLQAPALAVPHEREESNSLVA